MITIQTPDKCKSLYLTLLLASMQFFLNCSEAVLINRQADPDFDNSTQYGKHIRLNMFDGRQLTYKKKFIEIDSQNVSMTDNSVRNSINISEIGSIRYSNTNLGFPGAGAGLLGWSIFTAIVYGEEKKDEPYSNGYSGPAIGYGSVIALPLFIGAGYLIGSKIHINWQRIDLTPYRKENISLGLKPMQDGIGIGLRVPLRR